MPFCFFSFFFFFIFLIFYLDYTQELHLLLRGGRLEDSGGRRDAEDEVFCLVRQRRGAGPVLLPDPVHTDLQILVRDVHVAAEDSAVGGPTLDVGLKGARGGSKDLVILRGGQLVTFDNGAAIGTVAIYMRKCGAPEGAYYV